jgi:hypothetical protein
MKLTEHFTLEEMTRSELATRKGIENAPDDVTVENLRLLCVNVLEPLRVKLGKSIHVNSGYRSVRVNQLVGGSGNSQHCKGEAADIVVEGMTAQELFDFIVSNDFPFDQIIQEFNAWVHISWRNPCRSQQLLARRIDGKVVYQHVT